MRFLTKKASCALIISLVDVSMFSLSPYKIIKSFEIGLIQIKALIVMAMVTPKVVSYPQPVRPLSAMRECIHLIPRHPQVHRPCGI